MWKWGSDSGLADIALAEQALEALERRRAGLYQQLEFWERAAQEVQRGPAE